MSKKLNNINGINTLKIPTNQVAELYKSMESMRIIIKDPLEDFRKRMESMRIIIKDPLEDFRKRMESMRIIIKDPLEDFRKRMESMRIIIKDPLEDFRKSLNIYRDVFQKSIPANNFEEAYTEVISRVVISRTDDDISEALLKTADEVELEIKSTIKNLLSIEFYLNFLIAFLFFVYSMQYSHESEKRIINKINAVQEVIIEKLEEVNIKKADDVYYVVQRPVNLRTKPTTKKSNIIKVLYPNQTTILIERKGKWIKVEYFNHLTGVHESGWCYKKYLKKIDNRP